MIITLDAKRRLTVPTGLAPAQPMSWLLDTDVICQPARRLGDGRVMEWLEQEQERLLSKAGQRMPVEDSYTAATARRHKLTIATGNDQDFRRPGLKVFNPFKELP